MELKVYKDWVSSPLLVLPMDNKEEQRCKALNISKLVSQQQWISPGPYGSWFYLRRLNKNNIKSERKKIYTNCQSRHKSTHEWFRTCRPKISVEMKQRFQDWDFHVYNIPHSMHDHSIIYTHSPLGYHARCYYVMQGDTVTIIQKFVYILVWSIV